MTAVAYAEEIDFESEALLDSSIRFQCPLSPHPVTPRNVFLTGSTGFLGAFLLDALLQKTEARIYCLVRAADRTQAYQRIAGHLRGYGLWNDSVGERIFAVPGDLSQNHMGLGRAEFTELAGRIDVIYHNAGWVNMALPYAQLKSANVAGTREVLRLAGAEITKPVHFVSSIAVFYTDTRENGSLLTEADIPVYDPTLRGGYSKSKWVADRLVARAQARGLPASIYRPVRIMGHSQTGAMNDTSDLLPLLLKGCILLGRYPAFDTKITLVPVDYVSRAMVHLAGQEKSWGRAFHFMNRTPVEWRRLMTTLRDFGYTLEEVGYDEWWRDLRQQVRRADTPLAHKRFLSTLIVAMTAPHFLFYRRPEMDSRYTDEGLEGAGISCPAVDDALIGTYLAWWQKTGFLPAC